MVALGLLLVEGSCRRLHVGRLQLGNKAGHEDELRGSCCGRFNSVLKDTLEAYLLGLTHSEPGPLCTWEGSAATPVISLMQMNSPLVM